MSDKDTAKAAPKTPPSQPPSGIKDSVSALKASQLAARARQKQQERQKAPMPQPPARRPVTPAPAAPAAPPAAATAGKVTAGAAAAAPDLTPRVRQIQQQFTTLEGQAQLSDLYTAIGNIDKQLLDFPNTLESLRQSGYVHSGALEGLLEQLDSRWDEVRPRVEATLRDHVQRIDREMGQVQPQIIGMQATESALRLGETLLNGLSRRIEAANTAVRGLYSPISTELDKIGWQLQRLSKMMALIAASPHIYLQKGEGPLAAVEAVWQRDGEKGPKGVLVLTDQRLLFEERDEVVTKRRFGIFKAESQKIQELHIETAVGEIQFTEAKKEGGFLGMGKDDILEMTFAATAPVSRARFHLQGQKSADWAELIKKIQSGEVDADRAGRYVAEAQALAETAASFPTTCPNCFAAIEPPGRGIMSVTCEFCGTIITPQKAAES